MSQKAKDRWGARFAGLASLALVALALGCGRPPDEAWLRFLGFTSSDSTVTTIEGELRDNKALTSTAKFENDSKNVGTAGGTGIDVYRIRIDYRMSGYSPPAADYGIDLYLPALGTAKDSTASTGTLTTTLVSTSLKQWLIDTGAFENTTSKPLVELTAQVTFYGKTDEGTKIETSGSIAITLTNKPGSTVTTGTNPTVSVIWQADAVIGGADGGFVVSRSGSTAAELKVEFTTSGSADSSNDYYDFGTSVLIPAGSSSAAIKVIARSTGTSGRTLIVNLGTTTSYTVGSPSSASLQITGGTKPIVTVARKANASRTGTDGGFTVSRSGSTSTELRVDFTTGGDAVIGTDYTDIGTSILISPGSASTTIPVYALPGGNCIPSCKKVIIYLTDSASYTVGSPSSASLQITD